MALPRAHLPPLKRRAQRHEWQGVLIRIGIALGLIMLAFSLLWLDRGGLRDNVDGQLSFSDILYFTMITVTTVGYGDLLLKEPWRLLGPIEAAVGILMLGWSTGLLVALLTRIYGQAK